MDILIVDDHELVREGVAQLVKHLDAVVTVWQASSGVEALEQLSKHAMNLVLLDVHLPGMDGFEILPAILKHSPSTPIVILSAVDNPMVQARFIHEGACAYVNKNMPSKEMLELFQTILQGDYQSIDLMLKKDVTCLQKVTPRQREILTMLKRGLRNKEIAVALNISEATVKVHIRTVTHILCVNNRHAAVCKAEELGLLSHLSQE